MAIYVIMQKVCSNLLMSAFLYAFNKITDILIKTEKSKIFEEYISVSIHAEVKENITEHNWLLDNKEIGKSSTAVSRVPLQSSDHMVYASSEIINSKI